MCLRNAPPLCLPFLTSAQHSNTIDHSILLKRLDIPFGFNGTVLVWFASYVGGRAQAVVMGPVLYTLYSQPLSDGISPHESAK